MCQIVNIRCAVMRVRFSLLDGLFYRLDLWF